jgi:2-iminobutanoate/2-iminopropanoate deaminase
MESTQKWNRRSFFCRLATVAGFLMRAPQLPAQAPSPTPQQTRRGPIVHNGLIFISGQGANDGGAVQGADIEAHTRKVMENIKRIVESGGGKMESILQLNVFLATLEDYEAMNKVYDTYFPNGGPARMTVAVAGVPGHSRVEINGIAAVVNA